MLAASDNAQWISTELITVLNGAMAQQQSRQLGVAAQYSVPATRDCRSEKDNDETYATHVDMLEYLASAQNSSMLESKFDVVCRTEEAFQSLLQSLENVCWLHRNTNILHLYTSAAANSMNAIVQDRISLLDRGKLVEIMTRLFHSMVQYMRNVCKLQSKERLKEVLHVEISAGLPTALVRFTEATWQAVQQIDSSNFQQQEQQQRVRHQPAAELTQQMLKNVSILSFGMLVNQLLAVWSELFRYRKSPVVHTAVVQALPLLIALTTDAVPLLRQARSCLGSSSGIPSGILAAYDAAVTMLAESGMCVASFVAVSMQEDTSQLLTEDWQQFKHQMGRIQQLPVLLLQLLTHQAGKLHAACGGLSQAAQHNHTAAASGVDSQQQQQQPLAGLVVPSSHLNLMQSIGLAYSDDHEPWSNQNINQLTSNYALALNAFHSVVLTRCTSAIQLNCTSSSGGGSDVRQQQQQQQQQQPVDPDNVLPRHLIVPAIKVLIEVVLLLPPEQGLAVHSASLEVILQLLHSAACPPAAAAAAAAAGKQKEAQQALAAAAPLPQVSAAVAAGLLQPVIAQLSQAVIYCLLKSDHHQQHDIATDRLAFLYHYGSLLIIICDAVEPKHIATVLQSQSAPDLLVSLAAIESVIRSQACHLAPAHWRQQRQQQQHQNVDSTSNVSSNNRSCLYNSMLDLPDQSALLLLSFVSMIVFALCRFVRSVHQQQCFTTLLDGSVGSTGYKLAARLFTLLTTALKVTACATSAVVPVEQHEWARTEALTTAVGVATVAQQWCDAATGAGQPLWCNADTSCAAQALPLVLLFRATRTWFCSWSGCDAPSEVAAAVANLSAARPAIDGAQQGMNAINITGANFTPTLFELISAFGFVKHAIQHYEAGLRAHAATGAAAAAEPLQHLQLQSIDAVSEKLRLLVEQETHVTASIFATLQLALQEIVSSEAASATEASGLASKSHGNERELHDILVRRIMTEGMHPSNHLRASLNHSLTLLRDLADAVVSCFPLTIGCSNPVCTNLTKLSEWQLVCGRACVCVGCKLARYCSSSCQKQHWKLHKIECQRQHAC